MKQRIRYVEKDGKLISIKPIISKRTGAKYTVFIDLETKTYCIRNIVTLRKYEGGDNINNLNVLKDRVKKHLEELGCEFGKEKRFRTFGRVPKGWSQEKQMQKLKENTHQ